MEGYEDEFTKRRREYLENRQPREYYCSRATAGLYPEDLDLYREGYKIVWRKDMPKSELEKIAKWKKKT